MRRTLIMYAVCWTLALVCGVTCAVGNADAGTRGVLSWHHDADELFIHSDARRTITFRCRWDLPHGWVGHTWGDLEPGETAVSWTWGDGHGFDCWRTDR